MINLSFAQAVAAYVLLFIIIFIGGLAFAFFQKYKQWYPKEFRLWQCTICGFVYSWLFDDNITVCPRCGSFNKKDTDAQTEQNDQSADNS
jgi:rubredoxin